MPYSCLRKIKLIEIVYLEHVAKNPGDHNAMYLFPKSLFVFHLTDFKV